MDGTSWPFDGTSWPLDGTKWPIDGANKAQKGWYELNSGYLLLACQYHFTVFGWHSLASVRYDKWASWGHSKFKAKTTKVEERISSLLIIQSQKYSI